MAEYIVHNNRGAVSWGMNTLKDAKLHAEGMARAGGTVTITRNGKPVSTYKADSMGVRYTSLNPKTYYVAYYGKIPCKGTMMDARRMAFNLLRDEDYGEMEVPIYKTRSARYGDFIGIAYLGHTMSDTKTYYEDRSGKYQLYRDGSLRKLGATHLPKRR